jgi:hypothetical protein
MSHQANITGKEIVAQDNFDVMEDNQTQVKHPDQLGAHE